VTRVLLIRHGETEWSRTRRHTGTTDLPLLPEGEAAARRLAPRLAGERPSLVLSSPLVRARRTAELAGLHPRVNADLREWDYGEYEGLTTLEIRAVRPDWDLWRDGCPGGETAREVGARVDEVLALVAAHARDETSILVAHGHVLRVLGARWIGLDPSAGGRLALDTAAVCELGLERERRVLRRWNDRAHLRDP
jgi:broad specificity phosphatase PhoE